MQAVTQSLSDGLGAILGALPALIGAIIILVIGFIIAKVLQGIVTRVLQSMGFEGWMESGGIKQFFDRSQTQQTPLSILGKLIFWLVFFIAITMAVDTLGISAISDVLAQFIAYIPQIIAAILILVLATLLANFVAGIVRGATGSNVIGRRAVRPSRRSSSKSRISKSRAILPRVQRSTARSSKPLACGASTRAPAASFRGTDS
jgi:hypothetical protein